ncbi:MAG: hypothetical protein V3T17_07720 [Pseudomonadales bacterium]
MTLSEIAGYELFYFLNGDFNNGVQLEFTDPTISSATVGPLASGSWEFQLLAYDTAGRYSTVPNSVTVVIP